MKSHRGLSLLLVAATIAAAGCVQFGTKHQARSSALEFLYPGGRPPTPPTDVKITIPVRVGIAFAPETGSGAAMFPEQQQKALLTKIADAFKERSFIASVQGIPRSYFQTGGGFTNLDQIAGMFGIDVMVLVSYDQVQFSETSNASFAYWTLIGAYIVKGEKNETRTLLDAAVFDIPSRSLLFNAPGQSGLKGSSTPVAVEKTLRASSAKGFDEATENLIANLGSALDEFQKQAESGTVRGAGTPAVAFYDASGTKLEPKEGGGWGGGAIGPGDMLATGALALSALIAWRSRRG